MLTDAPLSLPLRLPSLRLCRQAELLLPMYPATAAATALLVLQPAAVLLLIAELEPSPVSPREAIVIPSPMRTDVPQLHPFPSRRSSDFQLRSARMLRFSVMADQHQLPSLL